MLNKTLRTSIITIISFAIFHLLWVYVLADLRASFEPVIANNSIRYIVSFSIIGIPVYIGIIAINGFKNFFHSMGLDKGFLKGLVFAFICTSPMLIGYASMNEFNPDFNWEWTIRWVLFVAFIEEFFYRSFLFGQLYRNTKLGFILSILGSTLLFSLAHAHQSEDLTTLVRIFLTTGIASILFAWVYVEWDNNLWAAFFLHLFMNMWWILFPSVGSNDASGSILANVFRLASIILIIGGTIVYKKKKSMPMAINKETLWVSK